MKNPALGGGRWIEVAPERFTTWVESFAQRHPGVVMTAADDHVVRFSADDGAMAECHVPLPPLTGKRPDDPDAVAEAARLIAEHVTASRTVGVLLVRLGGYAAGVFTGSPPRLVASKVGSRLVHGRSAAGGQSQQRFARRREKQAAEATTAAADNAVEVFGPFLRRRGDSAAGPSATRLDVVVLGGDRAAVGALRGDQRLASCFSLATDRFLTVPDPRLAVLRETPRLFRAIRIRLVDPA
jgi:hypothetical protein